MKAEYVSELAVGNETRKYLGGVQRRKRVCDTAGSGEKTDSISYYHTVGISHIVLCEVINSVWKFGPDLGNSGFRALAWAEKPRSWVKPPRLPHTKLKLYLKGQFFSFSENWTASKNPKL